MVSDENALLELLGELKSRGYQFTCVTPATHERVLARPLSRPTLRDIFGWNRPFGDGDLPAELLHLLKRAMRADDGQLRSLVRVASLDGSLFLHSSYPTNDKDAVFFGPDTYRFVRFVCASLPQLDRAERLVDMGTGSGAGGIILAARFPSARVTLVDLNPAAVKLARINATFAGVEVDFMLSDQIPEGCDLVVANPPYMIDAAHRSYRDGGGRAGGDIAYRWARQALQALVPGGTMLLYTGAAVVRGRARLVDDIEALCREARASLTLDELDPDIFGEELGKPEYADVERIAALGLRITKP